MMMGACICKRERERRQKFQEEFGVQGSDTTVVYEIEITHILRHRSTQYELSSSYQVLFILLAQQLALPMYNNRERVED
jgi:hypothetical protein